VAHPQRCAGCDNGTLLKELKNDSCLEWGCPYFDDIELDLKGLAESKSKNGIPIFVSNDGVFAITEQADKLFESFKPLNIVTDTFSDREGGIFYVKDNQKNIVAYSLDHLQEIENRFPWGLRDAEMFCVPKGPLCLLSQIKDWPFGAMLAPRTIDKETDFNQTGFDIATRLRKLCFEAEEFFGVEINANRESLKSRIQALSEGDLIKLVLVPILHAQGFQGAKPVSFHGPGERGGDFYPFYKINEFGKIVYYSAQAKAVKIHSKAGVKDGNVNQLIDQMEKLFRTSFKTFIDNTEKKITHAFIFCSKEITSEAREQIFNAFENRQQISLIDIDDIVSTIVEKGLASQILESCLKKEVKESGTSQPQFHSKLKS
jgi:hypothetical protein